MLNDSLTIPLDVCLLESGNQFLVLYLEVAQHVLLVQVTAEGIVYLHRALGGAHHGMLGLEDFLEKLLARTLVRLEVELVASLLARAYHSARYHLRLFADNLGIVPWRLAEGDGAVFLTDDGSVHLLGVEELLLCCLFHNRYNLFKR